MKNVISVFGGSTPAEGMPAYAEARWLGRRLAEAGYVVATGGYSGVMAGASQGAREAGGHVIGVTCGLFDTTRLRPNPWVVEEIKYPTLRERLSHLVEKCDAAIALPGGIGTLSEIALTWSLLQTGEIPSKPFVLVGENWQKVLTTFYRGAEAYVEEKHWRLLVFVSQVDSALRVLRSAMR